MPLANKRVVLTRSPADNLVWAAYLDRYEAKTYSLPTIITEPVTVTPALESALRRLGRFDWLIFTSAAGVRHTQHLITGLNLELTRLQWPLIAVVGEETAAAARAAELSIAFQPTQANTAMLAAELPSITSKKTLLLRSGLATHQLAQILARRSAIITDLAVYQTKLRTEPDLEFARLLQAGQIGYLTFASPSAVRGFAATLGSSRLALAPKLPAISIGSP